MARAFDGSVPVAPYIESGTSGGTEWLTTSNTSSKLRQLLESWLQSLTTSAVVAASVFNGAFGVCHLSSHSACVVLAMNTSQIRASIAGGMCFFGNRGRSAALYATVDDSHVRTTSGNNAPGHDCDKDHVKYIVPYILNDFRVKDSAHAAIVLNQRRLSSN
jgi:hypothetical protein